MSDAVGSDTVAGVEVPTQPIVYVIDDESEVRRAIAFFLKTAGYRSRPYLSGSDFLSDAAELEAGCVLLDLRLGEEDGLDVLARLGSQPGRMPVIIMTGHGDVSVAVRAMKLGAIDFLEKPFADDLLLDALRRGFGLLNATIEEDRDQREAAKRLQALTPRERDVLGYLAEGKSNKEVAIVLDLSVRTVEMHRATMFDRLGVRTLPEALKLAFRARTDLSPVEGTAARK